MSEKFKDYQQICRICHSKGLKEELLSPCECRGTLSHIHSKCLIDWINVSKTDKCEVCLSQYNCIEMIRTLPSFMAFMVSIFKYAISDITARRFLVIITIFILLVSLITYFSYILFPNLDFILKMCVALAGVLGLVVGMTAPSLIHMFRMWRTMYAIVYIKIKPIAKN